MCCIDLCTDLFPNIKKPRSNISAARFFLTHTLRRVNHSRPRIAFQLLTMPVADRQPIQLQRTLPAAASAGDAAVQLPLTEQQFESTNTATNEQPLPFLDS